MKNGQSEHCTIEREPDEQELSEAALIEEFRLEYSWKYEDEDDAPAGCVGGKLDPSWKKNGLFGAIGERPSCILHRGLGRPSNKIPDQNRGSETLYLEESAIERLRYLVAATEAGLGAEKIKTALENGVPEHAFEVCGNEQSGRCILTRPLVMLLNLKNPARIDQKRKIDLYNKVWHPYDPPQIKEQTPSPAISASGAALLAGKNPNLPAVRDKISLSIYLNSPGNRRTTEDGDLVNEVDYYFKGLDSSEGKQAIEALKRIVSADFGGQGKPDKESESHDIERIKKHARPGYALSCTTYPPPSPDAKIRREHPVHLLVVYEGEGIELANPKPMTLLEHSCSHLLAILKEKDRWVRRCERQRRKRRKSETIIERCPKFFAVYEQDCKGCGTSYCKQFYEAPEGRQSPELIVETLSEK